MRRRRAPLLAPLLAVVFAAALALTACGGGDGGGGDGDGDDGAAPTAPASASASDGAAPGPAPEDEQEEADDGIPDETVPTDELTPPEGEFSEEQQGYLTDRVPEGVDPGAILDLGAEACDRIGYLERHDREAAVAALRDGEIPDAEPAVEHLCPEYAELLTEARGEQ
ncbi:hypothetical protein [Streptomyces radicis]|uniref:DUF732 domain-containing protein n=1 Tax=Streptomyces radicis TaxID=1750517 RepID=A0A3A9WH51_9ACTN|nr:hypothetical protein [Streptomyces radicis]RKN12140.1 hypothetical protein D7319_04500 [Streptomyces radicis]RKN25807.1 hypothetical protein D7318_05980 [Streptomyces radicis]